MNCPAGVVKRKPVQASGHMGKLDGDTWWTGESQHEFK